MQGGYITAAFDNVFGPLRYLAARRPCSTLNLHTQFVRSVKAGDTLTVKATIVSRGTSTMLLTGEAFNGRGKLDASAAANVVIMRGWIDPFAPGFICRV
jgi:acyl-coenzyme A thioesterase PaaI-like protein